MNYNLWFAVTPSIIVIFQLILPSLCFTVPDSSLTKNEKDSRVNTDNEEIEVSLQRNKRKGDLAEDSGYSYNIKFRAFGKDYDGELVRPSRSIFSPNFRYLEMGNDTESNINVREATPTKEELKEIEESHFISPSLLGALSLQEVDGFRRIRGTIGDLLINSVRNSRESEAKDKKQILTDLKNRLMDLHAIVVSRKGESSERKNDYIDPGQVLTKISGRMVRTKQVVEVRPEVLIIVDKMKYDEFKGEKKEMLDYFAVFFHGVNVLYSGISDPKITFRISGVTSMSSKESQPFIEKGKSADGKVYDLAKILENFSKWVFNKKDTLPKHDIAVLITGLDVYMMKDGTMAAGVAGLSFLKAACYIEPKLSKSMTVSVSEDIGNRYHGIFNVAHELAHNLGAPHDGDGEAKECRWRDGYIMSYEGWGSANKFKFSPCSEKLMKEYITSSGGLCLTNQNVEVVPLSPEFPGDKINMDEFCKQVTKSPTGYADVITQSPTENCRQLHCRYIKTGPKGIGTVQKIVGPALENSPCGNGGKCTKGECIGEKSKLLPGERTDPDKYCQLSTGSPAANADKAQSGDERCRNLKCTMTTTRGTMAMKIGPALLGSVCGSGGKCISEICEGG